LLRLETIALIAPGFLFAITVHEFAHAYVANRFGDPTAKDMGRLTLNPLPHLDIFGTIALFLIGFGWAKPVIVNPRNLQNPRKDNLWIALGGPVMNLITAFVLGMLFRALMPILPDNSTAQIFMTMLILAVRINIILAVFNLLPLPPLDGFHVVEGLVSNATYIRLQGFERYGSFVLLGLILISNFANINIFGHLFNPFLALFGGLFTGQNLAF
jgi:Zn-dependent protease